MNLIKPKKLKMGDIIGFIATSGNIENDQNILNAKKFFESKGYKVVVSKNVLAKDRYLAGNDKIRLEEFHNFFEDSSINAIICVRGGYGAIRLINDIDYTLIRKNPKIFAGYSDITALSAMILHRSRLITYSAPMIQSDFGQKELSKYTLDSFFQTLCEEKMLKFNAEKIYKKGHAEGLLFGGNLSTITSLCGIEFIPDEKFIFFAEDLNEPVYKIDKMFTQLLNIEKFRNNLAGIILGEFSNTDNPLWLNELFIELSDKINVPIIVNNKITHSKDKLTLPFGANIIIDNSFFEFYT